ncbi:MAG: type 2 isopentenyl-diphosphate Delta-isomerase [Ignavibacteriaceae bacterium]
MPENPNLTPQRKKEHIEICLTDDAAFRNKTNGFEKYDFLHCAITEVDISSINFETIFLAKKISYPFLISCMTGGAAESENINSRLAEAAGNLNIPLGVGSQRQALENKNFHNTYKTIRVKAPQIPILGNIGASQIVKMKSFDEVKYLVDLVEADAMAIHINPVQELIQKNGEPFFEGLLKSIGQLVKDIDVPVIAKEVGAGISRDAAKKLIEAGVQGIDVAGAGGTSWSGVEIIRNKNNASSEFWDWGIPTSYCLRTINELKSRYDFTLIGSGGINSAFDAAKAFALGADITASARIILQELHKSGPDGVQQLITGWFEIIRKVMFLTGSGTLKELRKNKLVKKEEFH